VNPKVAIVILNWNGRKYLEQFLPSVIQSDYSNLEIVIADNGSTDDSIAYIKEHFPFIRLIQFPENFGFAKGYNEALKQIKAEYFVLLNSDVETTRNWINPVIQLMQADASIGVCQPKILMYSNRSQFEYAGGAGGWLDYLGYPFARGRVFDICEQDTGQYDETAPVFWASGAAMFVRAHLYNQLNGLDEYFFAHQEEIDFCWRIQLAGYKVYSCPASVVYHVGGGTLPKGNAIKVFLNFRNNLVMLAKNLPASQSWWKIPFRFLLDTISAFKSLFDGQATYFIAVFRSHVAFIGWLFSKKQKAFYPKKRNGQLNGWFNQSVVWLHFIKGRKRFSEIVQQEKTAPSTAIVPIRKES
jgi:GT2 family glycosyltransferase